MPPAAALTVAQRRRLTAVARGAAAADLYVRGGTLLNVYTGEIYPANVAIAGERIAYVGPRDDMVGPRTRTLAAAGRVVVPGYIDPHVHPAHVVTPAALARHVLPLGTTTVFADTLQFWELGGLRAFRTVADALAGSPLKFYWMIRVHAQARSLDEPRRYPWGDTDATPERANLDQTAFGPVPAGALAAGASAYGVLGLVGDAWEWTSSEFSGYAGYRAFPYREYSEVFFGSDYKVLRGGSWAAHPSAVRSTFRNWDLPIRRQIFAGFRCARDA